MNVFFKFLNWLDWTFFGGIRLTPENTKESIKILRRAYPDFRISRTSTGLSIFRSAVRSATVQFGDKIKMNGNLVSIMPKNGAASTIYMGRNS
jgi:hypothetical protein